MSYSFEQIYGNVRGNRAEGDDIPEEGEGNEDVDIDNQTGPQDQEGGRASYTFPSRNQGQNNYSVPYSNSKQKTPSVNWNDESTLKHLGLSTELFKEKKENNPLLKAHMTDFQSKAEIWSWSKLPLQDQLSAKKLGIRFYDPHVLKEEDSTTQERQHVLRQQLDTGHLDASGHMPRKKNHVFDFFLQSSKQLQKLPPLFDSPDVEKCVKFFEDFQLKTPAQLPTNKLFVQLLLQLLGEEWYALLSIRKILPVLSKALKEIDSELPGHPSVKFLHTMRWNLHNIVKIAAMHDGFIGSAKIAAQYDKDPNAWNFTIKKLKVRKEEYRFQESKSDLWRAYSDMTVDSNVVERALKRRKASLNYRSKNGKKGNQKKGKGKGGKKNRGNKANKNKQGKGKNKNRGKGNKGNGKGSQKGTKRKDKPTADPPSKAPYNPHKDKKCHLCGALGHIQAKCPLRG